MQSRVAIVETRPETSSQDYRRVMNLAGLIPKDGAESSVLLPQWSGAQFKPGFDSPPWQILGVQEALVSPDEVAAGCRVLPVNSRGPAAHGGQAGDPAQKKVLERCGASIPTAGVSSLKPYRAAGVLPALGAVLPEGIAGPPVLANTQVLLLPVPELNGQWLIAGSVALLFRLFAGGARRVKKIPRTEVIAETVALAEEFFSGQSVVMDGVAWGIHGQDGKPGPLLRNILLAGRDPVAVDAVAARLAGLNPGQISWLQLCQDRGLGNANLDRIDIRGRKDLLDLDFQFPQGTFGSPGGHGGLLNWPGRALGVLGRSDRDHSFAASGWGRMLEKLKTEVNA